MLDGRLGVCLAGHVHFEVSGLAAGITDVLGNLFDAVFVQVSDADGCTLCGPVLSNGGPHTLGGAGDESFSPSKTFSVHIVSPR
ncbi:MAG: Uncharacterised protein [Cellulomonadaceae bacterium TMED98]|nr:MAG: Uncharacterised protein [Cellulomonadaceae bacterium TMED98]